MPTRPCKERRRSGGTAITARRARVLQATVLAAALPFTAWTPPSVGGPPTPVPVSAATVLGPITMRSPSFGWAALRVGATSAFAVTRDGGKVWQALDLPSGAYVAGWAPTGAGAWVLAATGSGVEVLCASAAAAPRMVPAALLGRPGWVGRNIPEWLVWSGSGGGAGVTLMAVPPTPVGLRPVRATSWRLDRGRLVPAAPPSPAPFPLLSWPTTPQGALRTESNGHASVSLSEDLGRRWRPVALNWAPVSDLSPWLGFSPVPVPGSGGRLATTLVLANGGRIVGWPGHLVGSAVEVLVGSTDGSAWRAAGAPLRIPAVIGWGTTHFWPQSARTWWLTASGTSVTHPKDTVSFVYHTTDAGRTWTRAELPLPAADLAAMSFLTPKIGWLTGSQDPTAATLLFATNNGGRTWTRVAYRVKMPPAR